MKKVVSVQQIADELNLSRNTVSKVLNGKPVPERTRLLVLTKARELNYKSMDYFYKRDKKSYNILLLSGKPLTNFNYFIPIINGIENTCYENEYNLFQYVIKIDDFNVNVIDEYLKSFKIDGIICIETFSNYFINKILEFNLPICFIDFSSTPIKKEVEYDIVGPDNFSPIFNFVNKMIEEGKTAFSFVGDIDHCLSFSERYYGMISAICNNNISHNKNEDILFPDDSSVYRNTNSLKMEIVKYLKKNQCFICANDGIASNVILALKSLGKKVPEEYYVLGFDDSIESKSCVVPISSVGLEKRKLGKIIVQTLIKRIENPGLPSSKINLGTKVIERLSTKKIN